MNTVLDRRKLVRFTAGLVSVVLVCLVALGAPLALAHGGEEVFSGEVGPYFVVANKSVEDSQGQSHLEYTIFLRDTEQRRPVSADRASIQVSADTPAGPIGPIDAEEFSNQYYVFEPIEQGGTWTMTVSIRGELGEASFSHELQLPRETWYGFVANASPLALAGAGVGVLVVIGGIGLWLRGRARQ